jgi:CIC family chloride channel protein
VLKLLASVVSLASGFRGGLFFASLLLGALLGRLFAWASIGVGLTPEMTPELAELVGMGALAVGVVGGPLTMSFFVLETTRDFGITAAVLVAAVITSFLVRETFGYSFSTWRLHLRGETIRGAHDVGRLRSLTVGGLMRRDVATEPRGMSLTDFCKRHALGSAERVIIVDPPDTYAGIVLVSEAHQALASGKGGEAPTVGALARLGDAALTPAMTADAAARAFAEAGVEELAVVSDTAQRRVVGLLTEAHLLRRYAEALDLGWRDLTGERN